MIEYINKIINEKNIDGYVIPKNDNYFTEYSNISYLQLATNFSGSAGFALILKNKKYLFVDGRYTLQAKKQCGNKFNILEIPFIWPKDLFKKINIKPNIGFDPNLFTYSILNRYFENSCNLIPVSKKIFNNIDKKNLDSKKFFFLNKKVVGESSNYKINRVLNVLSKKKIKHLFVSAGENVCWLLNIRGYDLPNSPVANCRIIISQDKKIYFFSNKKKIKEIKEKLKNLKISFHQENEFFEILNSLKKGSFCIDNQTCSVFNEELINSKFKIVDKIDPIYFFKSIKNKIEINNMIKSHIEDGVALTKFLYWIKNENIKNISERDVENKLEKFRKKSNNYLYPSFNTIAGSGPNGAIIHYRSNKSTNRKLNHKDLLLIDSGGQYRWGTTDVTRTICFGKIDEKIKQIFTKVLKGHIAVAISKINKNTTGHDLDKKARKSLNSVGLDYRHGTGHGVGFFLNVHEGPQSISKNNKIKLHEGMVLSNEPGFYLENKFGIRIENLVYIKKIRNNLKFKNLTVAPIDKDMVNFNLLTKIERDYLIKYHLKVYSEISPFLNKKEKKWLAKSIY